MISLTLDWKKEGDDYIACLTGGDAHVGAVAVGFYDKASGRASSSVITTPGHRETEIAALGANVMSENCKSTSVFIVGIHLDNITKDEIEEIVSVSEEMIHELSVIIQEGV
ncbi:hypothetical protein [Methanolobus sp.]|uniref:prenylated flavin chaperone LpdD n=1 Tax=Methanolobus sp. TaxID=1874737 RepID=UPI0025E212EA|nr:hypothetical protein [Methanolobus sp.]